MLKRTGAQAAIGTLLLIIMSCSRTVSDPVSISNTRLLPPPDQINTSLPQSTAPAPGQDIVLRGVAFAKTGDGGFPPDSRLTIRVFDAQTVNQGNGLAERIYTRSGVLPWPYELRLRSADLRNLFRPALSARLEGPDGRLIYKSDTAVPFSPEHDADIPLSLVIGDGVAALPGEKPIEQHIGAPIAQNPITSFGIPDLRSGYGAPTYDAPAYPGQTFESTTISGPPSNTIF